MRARVTRKRRIGIAAVAMVFALSGCVRGLAVDAGRTNRIIGFFSWDRGYMHDWPEVEPQQGVWADAANGPIADDERYWNSLGRQYIWPGEIVWAHEKTAGEKIPLRGQ